MLFVIQLWFNTEDENIISEMRICCNKTNYLVEIYIFIIFFIHQKQNINEKKMLSESLKNFGVLHYIVIIIFLL